MLTYACQTEKAQERQGASQHSGRREEQRVNPGECRKAEAPIERRGARLETYGCGVAPESRRDEISVACKRTRLLLDAVSCRATVCGMNKNTKRRLTQIRRERLADKIHRIQAERREAVKNSPMKPVIVKA